VSRTTSSPLATHPAWDVAYLFPDQGTWSDDDYLALESTRLIEFDDGRVEVLSMPTEEHQSIVLFLFSMLKAFVDQRKLGKVLTAPFPILLWDGKYREPDVMFMLKTHSRRRTNRFWKGADLVMEVVSRSPKDRARDLRTKRTEYARAGIAEYWIVDPATQSILVLGLEGNRYVEIGAHHARNNDIARSKLLEGFSVSTRDTFKQSSR
jgi:Uma2 family endonuclease